MPLEDLPESQRDPAAPPSDRDTALTVRAALAALPFAQRNTLLLYYVQGFTAPEIAAITRTTVPTVRYRLHRAVRRLRELLKVPIDTDLAAAFDAGQIEDFPTNYMAELAEKLSTSSSPARIPSWSSPTPQ